MRVFFNACFSTPIYQQTFLTNPRPPSFPTQTDTGGYQCSEWGPLLSPPYPCTSSEFSRWNYTTAAGDAILSACPVSCDVCDEGGCPNLGEEGGGCVPGEVGTETTAPTPQPGRNENKGEDEVRGDNRTNKAFISEKAKRTFSSGFLKPTAFHTTLTPLQPSF